MAKKKEPSISDALSMFLNVLDRLNLKSYVFMNRNMFMKEKCTLIVPNQTLWNVFQMDEECKKKYQGTELDIKADENFYIKQLMCYANMNPSSWLDLPGKELYEGKIVDVTLEGYKYKLEFNKNTFPIKLRKTEWDQLSYGIFEDVNIYDILAYENIIIMGLRKHFTGVVPDTDFEVIKLFCLI